MRRLSQEMRLTVDLSQMIQALRSVLGVNVEDIAKEWETWWTRDWRGHGEL